MQKQKTILFCPLNWGLGHATRIVPLVYRSINDGHRVILAAHGSAYLFLKQEFPGIELIYLTGFSVRYWPRPFYILGLFIQLPLFYIDIIFDRQRITKICKQYLVDEIISDNRYGCRTNYTHNVLITHQLFIKTPKALKWTERLVQRISLALVKSFNECWVPDYKDFNESLAGELSHGSFLPLNVKYIGPLSRFSEIDSKYNSGISIFPDVLILISGPEPSRSFFEREMEKRFSYSEKSVLMVCGKPGKTIQNTGSKIRKVSHLSTAEMYAYLVNSKHIISRCGYSTIMDLHLLNRSAELIPTPGQPEQEYLFEYNQLKNKKGS